MNNNDRNENRDIDMSSDKPVGHGRRHRDSKHIEGDNIQQKGSFGVGVNKGTINNETHIHQSPPEKPFKPIKYIPKLGSANFVGRQDELASIHEKFDAQNNKVAISSVSGMVV